MSNIISIRRQKNRPFLGLFDSLLLFLSYIFSSIDNFIVFFFHNSRYLYGCCLKDLMSIITIKLLCVVGEIVLIQFFFSRLFHNSLNIFVVAVGYGVVVDDVWLFYSTCPYECFSLILIVKRPEKI